MQAHIKQPPVAFCGTSEVRRHSAQHLCAETVMGICGGHRSLHILTGELLLFYTINPAVKRPFCKKQPRNYRENSLENSNFLSKFLKNPGKGRLQRNRPFIILPAQYMRPSKFFRWSSRTNCHGQAADGSADRGLHRWHSFGTKSDTDIPAP